MRDTVDRMKLSSGGSTISNSFLISLYLHACDFIPFVDHSLCGSNCSTACIMGACKPISEGVLCVPRYHATEDEAKVAGRMPYIQMLSRICTQSL